MIDKRVPSVAAALDGIADGATVLVGGFGAVGQPNQLIDGLIEQGARDLVIVANNSGVAEFGLAKLMKLGRVRRIVCSYPRSAGSFVFEELYRAGRIELELVPQGTLAERRRAHRGVGGGPLGQPHLQGQRAELQSGDGHRRQADGGAGAARGGAGRAGARMRCHAGHLRGPRGARAA